MPEEKVASDRPERKTPSQPAPGRLAIAFQEPLATIIRLHKAKADFRARIQGQLNRSGREASRVGYSGDDIELARFAVVAFLDEAVLHSKNEVLANWEQLLGDDAGE